MIWDNNFTTLLNVRMCSIGRLCLGGAYINQLFRDEAITLSTMIVLFIFTRTIAQETRHIAILGSLFA